MARDTCRVRQIVVPIRVALAALQRSVRTRQGPTRGCMIKCCRRPRRCVVANLALLGEARRDVIRVVGSPKILQMATYASGVADVVVAIQVTLGALNARVRTSKRKSRLRVIECRRHPRRGGMTHFARLRYSRGRMIRIRRSLIILQVAGNTCRRSEIKVAIGVALIALQVRVATRQWESHRVVIETGRLPCGR